MAIKDLCNRTLSTSENISSKRGRRPFYQLENRSGLVDELMQASLERDDIPPISRSQAEFLVDWIDRTCRNDERSIRNILTLEEWEGFIANGLRPETIQSQRDQQARIEAEEQANPPWYPEDEVVNWSHTREKKPGKDQSTNLKHLVQNIAKNTPHIEKVAIDRYDSEFRISNKAGLAQEIQTALQEGGLPAVSALQINLILFTIEFCLLTNTSRQDQRPFVFGINYEHFVSLQNQRDGSPAPISPLNPIIDNDRGRSDTILLMLNFASKRYGEKQDKFITYLQEKSQELGMPPINRRQAELLYQNKKTEREMNQERIKRHSIDQEVLWKGFVNLGNASASKAVASAWSQRRNQLESNPPQNAREAGAYLVAEADDLQTPTESPLGNQESPPLNWNSANTYNLQYASFQDKGKPGPDLNFWDVAGPHGYIKVSAHTPARNDLDHHVISYGEMLWLHGKSLNRTGSMVQLAYHPDRAINDLSTHIRREQPDIGFNLNHGIPSIPIDENGDLILPDSPRVHRYKGILSEGTTRIQVVEVKGVEGEARTIKLGAQAWVDYFNFHQKWARNPLKGWIFNSCNGAEEAQAVIDAVEDTHQPLLFAIGGLGNIPGKISGFFQMKFLEHLQTQSHAPSQHGIALAFFYAQQEVISEYSKPSYSQEDKDWAWTMIRRTELFIRKNPPTPSKIEDRWISKPPKDRLAELFIDYSAFKQKVRDAQQLKGDKQQEALSQLEGAGFLLRPEMGALLLEAMFQTRFPNKSLEDPNCPEARTFLAVVHENPTAAVEYAKNLGVLNTIDDLEATSILKDAINSSGYLKEKGLAKDRALSKSPNTLNDLMLFAHYAMKEGKIDYAEAALRSVYRYEYGEDNSITFEGFIENFPWDSSIPNNLEKLAVLLHDLGFPREVTSDPTKVKHLASLFKKLIDLYHQYINSEPMQSTSMPTAELQPVTSWQEAITAFRDNGSRPPSNPKLLTNDILDICIEKVLQPEHREDPKAKEKVARSIMAKPAGFIQLLKMHGVHLFRDDTSWHDQLFFLKLIVHQSGYLHESGEWKPNASDIVNLHLAYQEYQANRRNTDLEYRKQVAQNLMRALANIEYQGDASNHLTEFTKMLRDEPDLLRILMLNGTDDFPPTNPTSSFVFVNDLIRDSQLIPERVEHLSLDPDTLNQLLTERASSTPPQTDLTSWLDSGTQVAIRATGKSDPLVSEATEPLTESTVTQVETTINTGDSRTSPQEPSLSTTKPASTSRTDIPEEIGALIDIESYFPSQNPTLLSGDYNLRHKLIEEIERQHGHVFFPHDPSSKQPDAANPMNVYPQFIDDLRYRRINPERYNWHVVSIGITDVVFALPKKRTAGDNASRAENIVENAIRTVWPDKRGVADMQESDFFNFDFAPKLETLVGAGGYVSIVPLNEGRFGPGNYSGYDRALNQAGFNPEKVEWYTIEVANKNINIAFPI